MNTDDGNEEGILTRCFLIPQRVVLGIMGFFAILCGYSLRICLSVAITRMVVIKNVTVTNDSESALCEPDPDFGKIDFVSYGLYDWSEKLQGLILSSFYIGYLITHIPGGVLAEKFGGKWTLSLGLLFGAICNILTPLSIKVGGPSLLIFVRILMGLGQGFLFPALSILIVQWVPLTERGSLGALILGGGQMGTILANSLSGFLLKYYDWPIVFYFFGVLNILWFIAFSLLCYSDPSSHPFIKQKEKDYLAQELGSLTQPKNISVPWGKILSNKQVLALVCGQLGYDWGFYVMVTYLPKYMSDVMRVSISNNGLYSSLPFLAMWVTSLLFGYVGDVLIANGVYSITTSRKAMTAICSFGPAIFLVAASYAGCNKLLVIIFFIIAMALMGAFYGGMQLSSMDLTPRYAGTLMGIVNGAGACNGFLGPFTVGAMTPHANLQEWRSVFWLTFVIKFVTGAIYVMFVTADVQPFNSISGEGEQVDK